MTVRPLTREVFDFILANMREQDRKEFEMLQSEDVWRGVQKGIAFAGYADDVPGTMWGLKPHGILEPATFWLASTPLLEKHKIAFLRNSKKFVDWCVQTHGVVGGTVAKSNIRAQNWLRWLGFSLGPEFFFEPYGLVLPFERRMF